MSSIKIVYLVAGLGQGGAEKQAVLHAWGQQQLGNEVVVLAVNGGARVGDLEQLGIEHHLMPSGRPVHDLRWLIDSCRWVDDEIRRLRPDVVHGFLPRSNLAATIVGRWRSVPVIVAGRRSLGHYHRAHPWINAAEYLLTRRASCVVTNSLSIADQVVSRREMPSGRVHVVPNSIEEMWLGPLHERSVPQCWKLVTVANLRQVKGLEVLVAALDQLARRGVVFEWTLVGEGALRGRLTELAHHRPWMTLAGPLGSDAVCELLDASDLYVGSSLSEGMSNSIMEAICRGLPVVATDVGATREVVGAAGVLVPHSRADLLGDAVRLVVDDPVLHSSLAAAAALQRHTFSTPLDAAVALDAIYRSYL